MTTTQDSFHFSTRLPRLIVTDLDGTLLNPQHTISERSIQALSHAQKHHLHVANGKEDKETRTIQTNGSSTVNTIATTQKPIQIMIASGRSPRSIQKVIDLFKGQMIPDTVICCNGALNYNPHTKQIAHPQFIPLDQCLLMVQRLRTVITTCPTPTSLVPPKTIEGFDLGPVEGHQRHSTSVNDSANQDDPLIPGRPGFACEVIWFEGMSTDTQEPIYAQDTTFVCDQVWEVQRKHSFYYKYTLLEEKEDGSATQPAMEEFIQSLQGRGGIIKLLALDRNRAAPEVFESLPKNMRPASSTLTSTTSTSEPKEAQMSLTYSGPYFLEASAAGVNKGLGLRKYCEANQISRDDVVAFGDLLNDAEMLQYAGMGLCMGNGHEDMKMLADRVIGTNAEDGVAKEIESWFV
ncbi:hypothetical protein BG011_000028 [Mortierella polycephala]|uniref:HAD-like protein n=1 Tax=Mortierella polycephala TaxID=41804 RepID=A0A9P6UBL5_9FUNG|nr:hypothetical protein BG011_000028 [Mortierella polycephala]